MFQSVQGRDNVTHTHTKKHQFLRSTVEEGGNMILNNKITDLLNITDDPRLRNVGPKQYKFLCLPRGMLFMGYDNLSKKTWGVRCLHP